MFPVGKRCEEHVSFSIEDLKEENAELRKERSALFALLETNQPKPVSCPKPLSICSKCFDSVLKVPIPGSPRGKNKSCGFEVSTLKAQLMESQVLSLQVLPLKMKQHEVVTRLDELKMELLRMQAQLESAYDDNDRVTSLLQLSQADTAQALHKCELYKNFQLELERKHQELVNSCDKLKDERLGLQRSVEAMSMRLRHSEEAHDVTASKLVSTAATYASQRCRDLESQTHLSVECLELRRINKFLSLRVSDLEKSLRERKGVMCIPLSLSCTSLDF